MSVSMTGGTRRVAASKAPYNVVRGRVEIRGTSAPVGALVVRVYDVLTDGATGALVRQPLGSTLTTGGSFEVCYDDEQLALYRREGGRPDILVAVQAPETMKDGDGPGCVLVETELRRAAAREESFLIHVDLAQLAQRSLLQPHLLGAAVADPDAAGIAAEVERTRQQLARDQVTAVRRKAVKEARAIEDQMERDVSARVIQHLTGVTPDMPQWRRFVAPGADVQEVARNNYREALTARINPEAGEGTGTYLVLSDEEFVALGNPPDPAKVEALLRRRNPTPTLLREDPMALACLGRRDDNPFDPPESEDPGPQPPPTPPPPVNADTKVAQLVDSIRSPEDLELGGRPDQDAVDANIRNMKLTKGPADVPAFYEFHNLQIAFDHVWEDARAEGYIERAKDLYRTAADMGGDPQAALGTHRDPLRALTREAYAVRQAQARFAEPMLQATPAAAARVAMMRRNDGPGPDPFPGGGGVYDPPEPPLPPVPPTPPLPPLPPHPFPGGGGTYDTGGVDEPSASSYPFTVFAANSINFGVLVTYQQRWEPTSYQVGRLVGTRTLAPKETISVTTRQVVKTQHNRKLAESSVQERKEETGETERDEAEIVARAQTKTNFALSTQGGYDLGPLGEGTATSSFGRESDTSSQETKKAFREMVRKTAQLFRNERHLTIESSTSTEDETTEKREISNPNDELAVTYIFYELQRRYRVSERLYRAMPVILVAQRVPRPEEIDETWLLRYDWIIRRFLPDDSFRSALSFLANRSTGDRIVLDELRRQMDTIRGVVETLKTEITNVRRQEAAQLREIQGYVDRKAAIEENEHGEGMFESAWEWAAGADEESRDAIRVLEESARERYERAAREEKDLRARLDRETTALQTATDAYTRAYAEYSNQKLQVNRLIEHVRNYVLHYMQGIWSYEHPDQQFFRHHTLNAPRLLALHRTYRLTELTEWPVGVVPQPGKGVYRVEFTTEVDPDVAEADKNATLAELADLDRPLGYKGNYIIYPLKKSNGLTDFMITPFLDAELGLRDPDGLGNWTLQEFSDYVQCLRKALSEEDFAEVEPILRQHYQELLADPLRDGEEITVPTQSLYMQMIVDTGKALEEFKAAHRLVDVMKVKAEVRSAELDNLRRAKMVLDDQLGDPNVESVKNVFYRGELPPHDGDE